MRERTPSHHGVAGDEADLDVVALHTEQQHRFDVDAGLRQLTRCFRERSRLVAKRDRRDLLLLELRAAIGERGTGLRWSCSSALPHSNGVSANPERPL